MSNPAMFLQNLTIRDKVNWSFVLANEILNFCNAIVKPEGLQSEQETREAVMCLFNSLPSSWIENDKDFEEDLKNSVIYAKVDNRAEWCGKRVGKPYCPHLKDAVQCPKCKNFKKCTVKEEKIEPYRLFHCIVNCLDKMNMLSKKSKIEIIDGKFKLHGIEDNDGDRTEDMEEGENGTESTAEQSEA